MHRPCGSKSKESRTYNYGCSVDSAAYILRLGDTFLTKVKRHRLSSIIFTAQPQIRLLLLNP